MLSYGVSLTKLNCTFAMRAADVQAAGTAEYGRCANEGTSWLAPSAGCTVAYSSTGAGAIVSLACDRQPAAARLLYQ